MVGAVSDERSDTSDLPEAPRPIAEPVADAAPESAESKLREERDKYKDQLLRTAADFDNYRKRTQKDIAEEKRRAREDVIRELLPVFDNLERAVSAATGASDVSAIVEGVRMVLRLFEDQAGRLGLTKIPAVGERFDPAIHDAIQQVETDEHAPGTVINEVVPGFRLDGKLVRPAMVVVARKPPAA
jgi:molecular chaperone GrpE